jgi:amino acid adenylation domain-containing protein
MISNVLEWLEEQAKRFPDKVIYESLDESVSTSELRDNARKIGSGILQYQSKTPIATFLDRDIRCIESYLGIVYSGHAYAPIDSLLPDDRIINILKVLSPEIIVTNSKWTEKVNALVSQLGYECNVLKYEDLLCTDVNSEKLISIQQSFVATDPLYVIFTSGSSGIPKGVITSHGSLINYIEAYSEMMNIDEQDRLGNQSPLDYIAAIRDIYVPLYKGSYTYIIPKEYFMQPRKLVECLNKKRITCVGWSASALVVLSKLKIFKEEPLKYLKKICFSGSVIPNFVLNEWQTNLPNSTFVNQYGPTEATASCTYFKLDHVVNLDEQIPIGQPYKNYKVFLLEDDGKICSSGEMGEICVGGPVLALGYYGDSERTKKSFIQNPTQHNYIDLIYKTGDFGVYNSQGNLEFIGRKDRQIKYLGHRVELDEVECAALKNTHIYEAAVIFDNEKEVIYLFYVGDEEKKDLILDLRKQIPSFMVPRKVIKLDEIPKLPNGKVDYKFLASKKEELE